MTRTEATTIVSIILANPVPHVRTATVCGGVIAGEYSVALHFLDGDILAVAGTSDVLSYCYPDR